MAGEPEVQRQHPSSLRLDPVSEKESVKSVCVCGYCCFGFGLTLARHSAACNPNIGRLWQEHHEYEVCLGSRVRSRFFLKRDVKSGCSKPSPSCKQNHPPWLCRLSLSQGRPCFWNGFKCCLVLIHKANCAYLQKKKKKIKQFPGKKGNEQKVTLPFSSLADTASSLGSPSAPDHTGAYCT